MISCRYVDTKDRPDLTFLNTDWSAVVWTVVTSVNMETNTGDTAINIKKLSMGQTVGYERAGVKFTATLHQSPEYGWIELEISAGMRVMVGDQPNMRVTEGTGKIIVFHVESEEGTRLFSQIIYCNDDLSLRTLSLFSVLNCLVSNPSGHDRLSQLKVPGVIKDDLRSVPVKFVANDEKDCLSDAGEPLLSNRRGIILDI